MRAHFFCFAPGQLGPKSNPGVALRRPPLRSLVNQQPKRRSIWLLSICGTITHSIHQIASWKYRKKLQKCSKSLIVKRLPTGCVHTATKPTIPLIGMTGWSMKLSLLPYKIYFYNQTYRMLMFLFYTPILDFLYASIRTFLSIYYNSLTILINHNSITIRFMSKLFASLSICKLLTTWSTPLCFDHQPYYI